jgi:hypothetical protein
MNDAERSELRDKMDAAGLRDESAAVRAAVAAWRPTRGSAVGSAPGRELTFEPDE